MFLPALPERCVSKSAGAEDERAGDDQSQNTLFTVEVFDARIVAVFVHHQLFLFSVRNMITTQREIE